MLKKTFQVMAGLKQPSLIAGYDAEKGVPKSVTLAKHHCNDCDTEIVANKLAATSCPVCASTMEVISSEDLVIKADAFEQLPALGSCDTCGTHYHAMPELASVMSERSFHCSVCSSIVEAEMSDEDISAEMDIDDTVEMDDSSEDETMDDESMSDVSMGDDADSEDELVDDMSDDMEMSEDSGEESDDMEMSEDEPLDDLSGDEEMADETLGDDVPSDDMTSDLGEDELTDDMSSDEDIEAGELPDEEEVAEETVEAKLIDYIQTGSSHQLVLAGGNDPKWYLFVDDVPVAISKKSQAKPSIASVYETEKFVTAFNTVAQDGISEESIKDFGFEPVEVNVPVDEVTKKQTEVAIEEATASLTKKINTIAATFEQALGIAAVGVNKGIWSGENPLRTALVAELGKCRVRNPEALVDTVFAKHSESLLKIIVAKATELSNKTPEAREEIAYMVSEATYRNAPVVSNTTKETEVIPFGKTPISFMTSAKTEEISKAKPSSDDDEIMSVVATLGRRF